MSEGEEVKRRRRRSSQEFQQNPPPPAVNGWELLLAFPQPPGRRDNIGQLFHGGKDLRIGNHGE
jgi:hypothetical protein